MIEPRTHALVCALTVSRDEMDELQEGVSDDDRSPIGSLLTRMRITVPSWLRTLKGRVELFSLVKLVYVERGLVCNF